MKKLISHSFFIVILTVVITFSVSVIMEMWIFKIAFPEQSALKDFEFEDFAFSARQTKQERDESIILVNIGMLSRAGIAEQINILNEYDPKVIGVNVLFNCAGYNDPVNCPQLLDTIGNTMLHEAIKKANNVVLVTQLVQSQATLGKKVLGYDSLEFSDSQFSNFSRNGFGNLLTSSTDHWNHSCRSFQPTWLMEDTMDYSFSVEICQVFDSIKTSKFLQRNNFEEIINYKGNVSIKGSSSRSEIEYFETLEYEDVLLKNFNPELIKDKIIILGYLGDYLLDNRADQMYFSPLNRVVLGKSLPDMYGVVIHANIVSMILREDYINKISVVKAWIISILIVFLNALLFEWLYQRNTVWYDALTLLIPAMQIVTIAYFRYFLFTHFNYILDLSIATVLLVSVSLSAGLYFGPLQRVIKKYKASKKPR